MRAFIQLLFLPLVVASFSASAHITQCEQILASPKPVTLRTLRQFSQVRIERSQRLARAPGFDNIEVEARTEQVGEQAPLALQQMLAPTVSLVSTPAPTSPDLATVSLIDEASSFPVHVDTNWKGHRTSTAVYASLPRPVALGEGKYLVGSNYKTALVFLHGGGTPTATGKNAMTLGEKLVAQGIPVIAPDLPGHGRATRNPDGLLTFQEQADWLMQVVDQLIDPSVKIVLAGHSWGGEFVVFLHRLSADPKYARIVQYIALSPPVDTSMGEGAEKRISYEQWMHQNYRTFASRIAPTDLTFLDNLLAHGKNADVGGIFTGLTNLDYSTPPLTLAEQKKLKPLTVVVGLNDGLVYVGREKQFEAVFGSLVAPSRLVLLAPGRTPKKPNEVILTGHGIFDVLIEGTTTPLVYNLIGEVMKSEGAEIDNTPVDKNLEIADQFLRNDLNFIAFREFIQRHVEYVDTGTQDLVVISDKKTQLNDYMKLVADRRETGKRGVEDKVLAAISQLRGRVGLKEALSLERAVEELALPAMTEARKTELEAYAARADAIDAKLKLDFRDPQSDSEIEGLKKEFSKLLADLNVTDLQDYVPIMKSMAGKKNLDATQDWQRSELTKLHQKFSQIVKGRQGRFSLARDRKMQEAHPPEGVQDLRGALRELRADRSVERRQSLQSFVDQYAQVETAARVEAEKNVEMVVEQLHKPFGLRSLAEADVLKTETDARLGYTFVPPQAPQLRAIAVRINELNDEIRKAHNGDQGELSIPKLDAAVRGQNTKRNAMIKKWDAIWVKNLVSSPAVQQSQETVAQTLEAYTRINDAYESARSQWLLRLKYSGRMSAPVLLAQTPEVLKLRRQMQHARKVFLSARETLAETRKREAQSGTLTGPPNIVSEATKIANELQSSTDLVRAEEDLLEQRRQRLSLAQREYDDLRVEYTVQMTALGLPVPYTVEAFSMASILNQPLQDLLREMSAKPQLVQAMKGTLATWETFLKEIRRDNANEE